MLQLVFFTVLNSESLLKVRTDRIDDPLIWGVLPFRYHFDPGNHRWSLGSHDIVFTNKLVAKLRVI